MNSSSQNQRFWHRLGIKARKARLASEIVGHASSHYKGSYFSVGLRFLDAYLRRFSPSEIVELDLLDVSKPRDHAAGFISKDGMIKLQQNFNPVELTDQTENKRNFERICGEAGLPTARNIAIVETHPEVSAFLDGKKISGEDAINKLLIGLPPGTYVIKPRDGAFGGGVRVFSCDGVNSSDAGDILKEHLQLHNEFDTWLVQSKLVNHEDVTRISPSSALQTVRLVTYVDSNGVVSVLLAAWRLADEKAEVDNFSGAAKNNILCSINPADGTVFKCWMRSRHPFGFGLHEVERHPVTGQRLTGVRPPMWDEIVKLGEKAALAFLPSRCLGWDVAVTRDGLVLIEANRYWDPHNEDSDMRQVVSFLLAERTKTDCQGKGHC